MWHAEDDLFFLYWKGKFYELVVTFKIKTDNRTERSLEIHFKHDSKIASLLRWRNQLSYAWIHLVRMMIKVRIYLIDFYCYIILWSIISRNLVNRTSKNYITCVIKYQSWGIECWSIVFDIHLSIYEKWKKKRINTLRTIHKLCTKANFKPYRPNHEQMRLIVFILGWICLK